MGEATIGGLWSLVVRSVFILTAALFLTGLAEEVLKMPWVSFIVVLVAILFVWRSVPKAYLAAITDRRILLLQKTQTPLDLLSRKQALTYEFSLLQEVKPGYGVWWNSLSLLTAQGKRLKLVFF